MQHYCIFICKQTIYVPIYVLAHTQRKVWKDIPQPSPVLPLKRKTEENQKKEEFRFWFSICGIAYILYHEQIIICLAEKRNKTKRWY